MLATTALLQIGYIFGCVVRVYAAAYLPARTIAALSALKIRAGISSQLVRIGIGVLLLWSRRSAPSGSFLV